MKHKIFLIFFYILVSFFSLHALSVGLDDEIQPSQDNITFPKGENGSNRINSYALMDNGFTLQDLTTTVSFASIFPVSGPLFLNGGKVFLEQNLVFNNFFSLNRAGCFYGRSRSISFPNVLDDLEIPADLGGDISFLSDPLIFNNTHLILNSDLRLNCQTTFVGECSIDGRGNKFILKDNGKVVIDESSRLVCQNVDIYGLAGTNFNCSKNNASWICQDSILTLSSDFEFATGAMQFKGDVVLTGTNKFIYSTTMSSTVESNSCLVLDNCLILSYAPKSSDRDLIQMQDETSCIYMSGCSLCTTTTGIRFTRGKLFLDNYVTFSTQGMAVSQAICFGNGVSSDDLGIYFLSGAQLNLCGRLEYENSF